jgi:predicted Zn-dependent protease
VALEHAPKSALLFGNRSLAYLKAQEPEKAAEDARQAVALEPQGGKGWVRLGDALMAKGDAATAKGSCEFLVYVVFSRWANADSSQHVQTRARLTCFRTA